MSCAFTGCVDPANCCLVGGCVTARFGRCLPRSEQLELKKNAMKLNGTKPARTDRDPSHIKRKRKPLTR
jgi:hypothetical protein